MDILILLLFVAISFMLFVGLWALLAYRKLYGHYFNFWIVLLIIMVPICNADDISVSKKPLVFPAEMPPAAIEIEKIVTPIIQSVSDMICPTCAADEATWRAGKQAWLDNDTIGNLSINFTA